MRFKVRPGDFLVEERIRLPRSAEGRYTLYRVRKWGRTTLQVQTAMAAALAVPPSALTFPALKDRNAVAIQFASLQGAGPSELRGEGFVAQRVGWAHRPLRPTDLEGNRFTLVLRDLTPDEVVHLSHALRWRSRIGLPNYFDEQRFGSLAPTAPAQGLPPFIGKAILQRDAQAALRLYLTVPFVGDPPAVRAFKAQAAAHWPDWATLFALAPRPSNFRSLLTFLQDHPTDFRRALNLIPDRLLTLYLTAYQSALWNRLVGRYLEGQGERGEGWWRLTIAGESLPLYEALAEERVRAWADLRVPLPHRRAVYDDPALEAAFRAVLETEGLRQEDLKARLLRRAYLPRGSRALLLFPQGVRVEGAEEDERFPGRQKLTVRFTLPPGGYATLVLKAVGGREGSRAGAA